jgi:hypothetical protein
VFVHADNIISSLHADNGKEFITTIVVDLIKESKPQLLHCHGASKNSTRPRISRERKQDCPASPKEHLFRKLFAVHQGELDKTPWTGHGGV